ncbi:MAG TPA: DUF1573 domain-containing protein [Flavobacteriales bacterium]
MNAPILAFTLMLSALLGAPSPRPEGSATEPEPGPRITFDTTVFDYGTIEHGGDGRCSFRFTNTGDAPLIIHTFQTSCGCLVPDWDKEPVMPGASGTVRLKYDTYRAGPINKSATLRSNAVNTPTVVLRIKGTVKPRME